MTGFTLINQSCSALVYAGLQTLTAVGLRVQAASPMRRPGHEEENTRERAGAGEGGGVPTHGQGCFKYTCSERCNAACFDVLARV